MATNEQTATFLYSECPECGKRRGVDEEQVIPCPECGNAEVENVWSDGQRSEAYGDAMCADEQIQETEGGRT